MLRAILCFALALGVVLSGLLLLRRSAGKAPPAESDTHRTPRITHDNPDKDDQDTW